MFSMFVLYASVLFLSRLSIPHVNNLYSMIPSITGSMIVVARLTTLLESVLILDRISESLPPLLSDTLGTLLDVFLTLLLLNCGQCCLCLLLHLPHV